MRDMATHVANAIGRPVSHSLAIRLPKKDRGGIGWLRHQAPVRPARYKDRKVMPENAVDE